MKFTNSLRTSLYTTVGALLLTLSSFAQAPEKMSYQAIVRDATGNLVTNQQVGMQISILQGTTPVYVETQTPTTNINGLATLEIGNGSVISGDFTTIDWAADTYFIKTETDPAGDANYSITSTSQLLSVPYALYANSAVTAITATNGTPAGGTEGQVLQMVEDVPTWITNSIFYKDTDGDGYGDINSIIAAGVAPNGYVTNNTDCNDSDPTINPTTVWYVGVDDDGDLHFGSTTSVIACEIPGTGYSTTPQTISDCDDTDPLVNNTNQTWYIDADGDGYGGSSIVACVRPSNGFLQPIVGSGTDDCDDNDPLVYTNQTWYIDADGDGYAGSSTIACARPSDGFLLLELLGSGTDDCDDTDPLVNNTNQTWYIDADGDGYGGSSIVACVRPSDGFLLSELSGSGTDDCDDNDPQVHTNQTWYIDADGDGYAGSSTIACARPSDGFLLSELSGSGTDDCNDGNPAIHPGHLEIAGDGIDNNCDGTRDELAIGQFIGGGIVFWIDPTDNTRSLVCAIKDQSAGIPWYNGSNITTMAEGTAIKTGVTNTATIIASQGPTATNYAAGIAKAYTNGPFSGWFLPSKDALNEMYLNRTAINTTLTVLGGVAQELSGSYWSSSEVNSELAWGQSFVDGSSQSENLKYFGGKVRAVREYPNYIGQIIDNGVVFYLTDNATTDLDGDGDYDLGLICAFSDVINKSWGCMDTDLISVPNVTTNGGNPVGLGAEIGDGMLNTTNILNDCPNAQAALAARSLGSEWFLPSIKELNEMYLNKATLESVPGFDAFISIEYWSSTEVSSGLAWYRYLYGDYISYSNKFDSYYVRAVRAF